MPVLCFKGRPSMQCGPWPSGCAEGRKGVATSGPACNGLIDQSAEMGVHGANIAHPNANALTLDTCCRAIQWRARAEWVDKRGTAVFLAPPTRLRLLRRRPGGPFSAGVGRAPKRAHLDQRDGAERTSIRTHVRTSYSYRCRATNPGAARFRVLPCRVPF
jgi:hypothetical protein